MSDEAPTTEAAKPAVVLCVDDEPNVLKALRRLFHSENYQLHLAASGAEGLAILQKEPVDLIISDMRMPEMDGAEFLTRVFKQRPNTIRILLTGYADFESTIEAVNNGRIFCYCNKPWNDEELKILVRNALEQKRLREGHERLTKIVHSQNKQLKSLNDNLEEKVKQRTAQLSETLQQLDHANNTLRKQYSESIKAFSRIIEMRPGIKSGHSKYIAEYAQAIANKLQLSEETTNDIVYAGLLSQIGKMTLPDELLKQPFYNQTLQQKTNYLKHAQEAEYLLKGLTQLDAAVTVIRHQYEHFDGSGGPDGLQGDKIPLGSRILAVIRDYIVCLEGSMTGQIMPDLKVRNRLQNYKNKLYDPEIVDIFLSHLDEMTATSNVRPVIEIPWVKLRPGMEVDEISYDGRIYLKNCVIDEKMIGYIVNLWTKGGISPLIKIRLGENDPLNNSQISAANPDS